MLHDGINSTAYIICIKTFFSKLKYLKYKPLALSTNPLQSNIKSRVFHVQLTGNWILISIPAVGMIPVKE
jgi:hypothetical protein